MYMSRQLENERLNYTADIIQRIRAAMVAAFYAGLAYIEPDLLLLLLPPSFMKVPRSGSPHSRLSR
ncbi:hypothetical protein BJX66DRAFT_291184 [Aspergillus keveii]|uniref:Uncharacterized protein n=1 Tax=Aspergillus keveii TaxID=714993 RepID=A0ABR4GNH0_9EURO